MTLKFFYENYKLNDLDISSVYVRNNKLYISLNMQIYLELIANGYRPELDVESSKVFIFNIDHQDVIIKKPYNVTRYDFSNDKLIIEMNNYLFIIENTLIEIK